jgi:hypothetical protein
MTGHRKYFSRSRVSFGCHRNPLAVSDAAATSSLSPSLYGGFQGFQAIRQVTRFYQLSVGVGELGQCVGILQPEFVRRWSHVEQRLDFQNRLPQDRPKLGRIPGLWRRFRAISPYPSRADLISKSQGGELWSGLTGERPTSILAYTRLEFAEVQGFNGWGDK